LRHALALPKRLVIFDLDGVVYRGDTPTVGAVEVIGRLQQRAIKVHFLTNNSSLSREAYCQKLTGMGIAAGDKQVMTSAYATALLLQQQGLTGARILVVGQGGLLDELARSGFRPVMAGEGFTGGPVDAVVVGIDRQFTYDRLHQAQRAILGGARFIATNRDATFPTETGDAPGAGSIVAAISTACGQEPFTVGKPNPFSLELILKAHQVRHEEAVLVGDRLDTDIMVGRAAGLETILTLTGVTGLDLLDNSSASVRPTAIISDLRDLERLLQPA
jgi:4-nitrophenyl phosphatase